MAMAGSIRKRGNTYSVRYEGPPGPDGRRRQREEMVRGTKRDAERQLRKRLDEVETGTFVPPRQPVTLRQYLREWLATYGPANLKKRTVADYESMYRLYLLDAIGDVKLTELRPEHVEAVYQDMLKRGLAPSTVVHLHRVLNRPLVLAVRSRRIAQNPLSMVTPPRVVRQQRDVWSVEQVKTFLAAIGANDFRDWFELSIYTGLRREEMAALRWQDVDLGSGTLRVMVIRVSVPRLGVVVETPKTPKSARRISISPEAVAVLHRARDDQGKRRANAGELWQETGYVFTDAKGEPIHPDLATKAFTEVVKQTGLPHMTLRDLRHLHATLLLLGDVHLKVVSERLGHSSVTVTGDIYSHVLPEVDRAASLVIDQRLAG